MSRKPNKIEIATPDEVAKYAEKPADQAANPPEAAGGGEAAPAGEAAPSASPAGADALRAELEQWKDKFLRAKAELANFQRRNNQERAESIRFANAEFARSMLNILDDLERAIAHAGGVMDDGDPVVHALTLIRDNFVKAMKQHGVEPIEAVGQRFDPVFHEAMMQRAADGYAEPTVLEELQKGYRLHDRVLRPAKVTISKPPEGTETGGEEGAAQP